MIVEQLYTKCLAQGAYYIESNGEVAIIDPLRETQPYIDLAESNNAKIKYVFETHFHADFVSGSNDFVAGKHSQRDRCSYIGNSFKHYKRRYYLITVARLYGNQTKKQI